MTLLSLLGNGLPDGIPIAASGGGEVPLFALLVESWLLVGLRGVNLDLTQPRDHLVFLGVEFDMDMDLIRRGALLKQWVPGIYAVRMIDIVWWQKEFYHGGVCQQV